MKKTPLSIKVGPYFDGDQITVDSYQNHRKPSKELLESVKLRPVYTSFPPPSQGRSPIAPYFHMPRFGYSNIQDLSSPPIFSLSPVPNAEYFESLGRMSLFGATMSSVNYFIGIGIFGLPVTLKISGWYGLIALIIIGLLMSYTGLLLGRCRYKLSLLSYPDIAEASYGLRGRIIVSIIFYFHLLFDLALFLVLLTNSFNAILLQFNIQWSKNLISGIITLILIILSNCITTLQSICYLSIIGTISTLLVCILIITMCSIQIYSNLSHKNSDLLLTRDSLFVWKNFEIEDIHQLAKLLQHIYLNILHNLNNLVRCFGIYSFCYMGHAVFPSIFKTMKSPSKYPQVVYLTFLMTILSYVGIASIGYIAYYNKCKGNIIENFPERSILTSVMTILTILTVITKYILGAFPISEGLIDGINIQLDDTFPNLSRHNSLNLHRMEYLGSIEMDLDDDDKIMTNRFHWICIFIRSVLPLIAMSLTIILPNFIKLIVIIGAIFGTLISIIIPTLAYIKLFQDTINRTELFHLWLLILLGICLSACSLVFSDIE